MTELTVLSTALHDGLFAKSEDDSGSFKVCLSENSQDAKLREVWVTDIPKQSVILKLDNAKIQGLFKGGGPNKRCDYVILTTLQGQKYAIFVEMKSTSFKVENGYLLQFKGAECLVDYCNSALNHFHGQADLLKQYKKRFVLFYKTSLNKTRFRHDKPPVNDAPERALRYPDPHNPTINSLVVA